MKISQTLPVRCERASEAFALERRHTRSFALAAAADPLPQTPPPVAAAPATSRRGQAGGALPGHGDTAGGLLLPLTFSPSPKGGKGMEGI